MPRLTIDGREIEAQAGQTVMQAATEAGIFIPYFCWHPKLSVPGNCRICVVGVEDKGGEWVEIACNMPVAEGMVVFTNSEKVKARRKATMQFITLNHPVDCGICDKAGECTLQDYHYEYNGERSISLDAKVHATKHYDLSERIVLDNERCIQCTRCVRFTREISKSNGLGMQNRADHTLVRAVEDGSFASDPYSDNVIDICPVGALLSRSFLHKARVWYLKPTASVCPGCARGCAVNLWHRRPEWKLRSAEQRVHNDEIDRVTPLDNPAVNGPWICNKGRDLARVFGRARAEGAMLKGRAADLQGAIKQARSLIAAAKRPVAIVSSWGSNEELAAFKAALGGRMTAFVKPDHQPEPGEVVEDAILIRADKNPNTAGARALFGDAAPDIPKDADLVLVWGEGFDFGRIPAGAKIVYLNAWLQPENGHADVFLAVSIQTERDGHYTNFAGVTSAFSKCFAKPAGVADAEALFAALAGTAGGGE
ncbi:MAG: (2Fe-2S)-binding protein [Betaproteobacteria bacterium]|nr:(2Fe-2S)-binding protein [Betaproteobacteria bacterium]